MSFEGVEKRNRAAKVKQWTTHYLDKKTNECNALVEQQKHNRAFKESLEQQEGINKRQRKEISQLKQVNEELRDKTTCYEKQIDLKDKHVFRLENTLSTMKQKERLDRMESII